jgi:hypothetical protein
VRRNPIAIGSTSPPYDALAVVAHHTSLSGTKSGALSAYVADSAPDARSLRTP